MALSVYGLIAMKLKYHMIVYCATSILSMVSHVINPIHGSSPASCKAYRKTDFYSTWRMLRLLPCLLGLGLILELGLILGLVGLGLVLVLDLVLVPILVLVGLDLQVNGCSLYYRNIRLA